MKSPNYYIVIELKKDKPVSVLNQYNKECIVMYKTSQNPEWDYDLDLELQLDNCKLNFNAVKSIDVAVRAKS